MAEQLPEGFTAPVCQALTEPHLMGGVPRTFFILNSMIGVMVVTGFHWYWYIAVALGLYGGMRLLTRMDPECLPVVCRALGYGPYYEA